VLRQLGENAFPVVPVRAIRQACRRYHNDRRFFDDVWSAIPLGRRGSPGGFYMALGVFRATIGQQIALLAAHCDLDIEGDLASVLPEPEEGDQ
jgi:hypothetical protein